MAVLIVFIIIFYSIFSINIGNYIIGSNLLTFNEAEAYCLSHESNLVTITNDLMNEEIKRLCQDNFISGSG